MGKLGVAGVAVAAVVLSAWLPSREAAAQDFGQNWIDRITHELEQERGPLTAKPFNFTAEVGVGYAYDSNIYLAPSTSKISDSIIVPFVQAGFTYGEPKFDLEASILANGKIYFKQTAADDDEERIFVRARQTASRWNFEISEMFQNVSDPSGALFSQRVSRVISNTIPKIAFDIGRQWAIELGANLQLVRFEDATTSLAQDNNSFTIDLTGVYRSAWGFDLLAQFGYQNLNYITAQTAGPATGAPDFIGYYYRVGFRGQIVERLTLEALVGWQNVRTDFFLASGNQILDGTVRADLNLRFEATEKINLYLDFARMYTFEGFTDPYQILNTAAAIAQMEFTEQFSLNIRAQYDRSDSALAVRRSYYGGSAAARYKVTSHLILDVSAAYRGGNVSNAGGSSISYTDFILSAGIAFGW
jgi:hypothetical protein